MEPNEIEVLNLLNCGNIKDALSKGLRLHKLGSEKNDISRAVEAIKNPGFYLQINKNPEELIEFGILALRVRLERSKKPKPS